ncbi:MAG: hypothetical protein IKF60_03620, partial [Solobacterium sp.]|nr:hypothetical protein [Solobacterium sp.]
IFDESSGLRVLYAPDDVYWKSGISLTSFGGTYESLLRANTFFGSRETEYYRRRLPEVLRENG